MLSETEAVLERIRHHEVETDEEEDAEKEWENSRRIDALARFKKLCNIFVFLLFVVILDMVKWLHALPAMWTYLFCQ